MELDRIQTEHEQSFLYFVTDCPRMENADEMLYFGNFDFHISGLNSDDGLHKHVYCFLLLCIVYYF